MVDSYRDDHIIDAIYVLLEILFNEDYFDYCRTCNSTCPVGYLDEDRICACCCEEMLVAA